MKNLAEKIKIGLTNEKQVEIWVENFCVDPQTGKSCSLEAPTLTRNLLAELTTDLVNRTFKVCDEALQEANLSTFTLDGVILVGGPTKMPLVREAVETYFSRKPLVGIDPDQVVATGAAIQANSLLSQDETSLLIDVTARSLGVGMKGGLMDIIIERNTPVPVDRSRTFTTSYDNQTAVRIPVFQGEWRYVKKNDPLGELVLTNLPEAPRGDIKVEVTFEIDTNGIVRVSAEDSKTHQKHQISINISGGLSENDIERLRQENKDAVTYAE